MNGYPLAVFLPGEFHGQRSLVGYSPWGRKEEETERLTLAFSYTHEIITMIKIANIFFSPQSFLVILCNSSLPPLHLYPLPHAIADLLLLSIDLFVSFRILCKWNCKACVLWFAFFHSEYFEIHVWSLHQQLIPFLFMDGFLSYAYIITFLFIYLLMDT